MSPFERNPCLHTHNDPTDRYMRKLDTAAASGSSPSIFSCSATSVPSLTQPALVCSPQRMPAVCVSSGPLSLALTSQSKTRLLLVCSMPGLWYPHAPSSSWFHFWISVWRPPIPINNNPQLMRVNTHTRTHTHRPTDTDTPTHIYIYTHTLSSRSA